jgi:hypothetical protein
MDELDQHFFKNFKDKRMRGSMTLINSEYLRSGRRALKQRDTSGMRNLYTQKAIENSMAINLRLSFDKQWKITKENTDGCSIPGQQ